MAAGGAGRNGQRTRPSSRKSVHRATRLSPPARIRLFAHRGFFFWKEEERRACDGLHALHGTQLKSYYLEAQLEQSRPASESKQSKFFWLAFDDRVICEFDRR